MRSALAFAGWCVLGAIFGCQLGESDVVVRSPDIGHGTDGSTGQDAVGVDAGTRDAVIYSDWFRLDGSGAMGDVPGTGGIRLDTDVGADVNSDVTCDVPIVPYDASNAGEVHDACSAEGYVFCENFENGASLWASTGGYWTISQDSDDAEANAVFGSTLPASSIAYVPSGAWQNMTVEAKVMVTSFGQASSSSRAIVYARYQDLTHFYGISLRGDGKLGLRRNATGFGTVASVSVGENEWHSLKIRVSGPADDVVVEGYLDGTLLTTATDTTGSLTSDVGTVAVGVYGGALAVFDDVSVSSP